MDSLYQEDLAYIHASGFGDVARRAAPEIVRRLQTATIPVRRVIDLGCGAGPLTRVLVDAGFDVTGIDASAELLDLARIAVPEAQFVHGSIYAVQLGNCHAVVAVGEPLTYHEQPETADELIRGFFLQLASILPSGGIFIFDAIGLGQPSLDGRFWKSGTDWAVAVETSENQDERTLVRKIETFRRMGNLYRREHEVHTVRLFDVKELQNWLDSCGFANEAAQSYGNQPLGPRRHAIFARRR